MIAEHGSAGIAEPDHAGGQGSRVKGQARMYVDRLAFEP